MNASGFLVPPFVAPRSADQAALWDQTFQRISPFLPELERELFPRPRTVVPVPFEDLQQGMKRRDSGQGVGGGAGPAGGGQGQQGAYEVGAQGVEGVPQGAPEGYFDQPRQVQGGQ